MFMPLVWSFSTYRIPSVVRKKKVWERRKKNNFNDKNHLFNLIKRCYWGGMRKKCTQQTVYSIIFRWKIIIEKMFSKKKNDRDKHEPNHINLNCHVSFVITYLMAIIFQILQLRSDSIPFPSLHLFFFQNTTEFLPFFFIRFFFVSIRAIRSKRRRTQSYTSHISIRYVENRIDTDYIGIINACTSSA